MFGMIRNRVFLAAAATAAVSMATSSTGFSHLQDSRKRRHNNFIADAVEVSLPSLVHIASVHHTFFGEMGTLGAGFVFDREGFVATNAHVVKTGGDNLTVTLANGKEYAGQVWAVDAASDLALVKLAVDDPNELSPFVLGDSKELRLGEWVVALGSPFNLQNSVTVGVVSSTARKGKELGMDSHSASFIQTDCSINSGNSGGPLVNLDGEVVGINTMKSGLGEGIAFSIPMEFAHPLLVELKTNKRVVRPYVGCRVVTVTPELVKHSRLAQAVPKGQEDGVLVVQVQKQSPCDRAGVRPGDVIVRVNSSPIKDASDLFSMLKVGQTFEVEFRRGEENRVVVKLTPEALLPKHVAAVVGA
ncbi:hypothetical protein BASA81_010562 [Batrachochytrium salamandrivorans]|nr:hypothetical protein BASA81_010562 [Batrachochytrium salamandrivorans]